MKEEDIDTRLTLHVENGRSQVNYRIMLSMDNNPSGKLLGTCKICLIMFVWDRINLGILQLTSNPPKNISYLCQIIFGGIHIYFVRLISILLICT